MSGSVCTGDSDGGPQCIGFHISIRSLGGPVADKVSQTMYPTQKLSGSAQMKASDTCEYMSFSFFGSLTPALGGSCCRPDDVTARIVRENQELRVGVSDVVRR